MSLEVSSCALPLGVECVGGGTTVDRRWSFLFPTLISLPVKVHACPFFFFFFNFSPYVFYCLFSSLTLLEMFFNAFNSVFKL